MSNTIQYAQVLQTALDKVAVQELLTGWMDRNSGKVKYNGGKEVKIPMISTDGLGDYARGASNGYAGGDIKFEYKTYEMTQDRGRKFTLDAMDVDETNFVATAGSVMGEFQRVHVTPEIDAYRLANLCKVAKNVKEYTIDKDTIVMEIKKGIKEIREAGYNGQLICHLTGDAKLAVEEKILDKLSSVTFSVNGIDTTVPAIDKVALIETPQNRMYTDITLHDGVTSGQEKGGYVKAANAKNMHFIIAPMDVPVAVTKQDIMRIFDPQTNQQANAWAMDYRRYHDLWVMENKKNSVYACVEAGA
ncbi:MAG: hypothetical protein ACRCXT_06880 [Paraclostridium sp.]